MKGKGKSGVYFKKIKVRWLGRATDKTSVCSYENDCTPCAMKKKFS